MRPETPDPDSRCPCGSGDTYAACCGRYHAAVRSGLGPGATAPTAEALMRSRYAAFAVGDAHYLLATWHPSTRPATLELDEGAQWRRLDVVRTTAGGPFDTDGTVDFAAHWRDEARRGTVREHSRFVREAGRWFYVDGDVENPER